MTLGDIWDMLCLLLNIRLGIIWAWDMHLHGLI